MEVLLHVSRLLSLSVSLSCRLYFQSVLLYDTGIQFVAIMNLSYRKLDC